MATYKQEVLDNVEDVERYYGMDLSYHILSCQKRGSRTDYLILQNLIIFDSVGIAFRFVDFTAEVLDSFVVEQTVGVDSANHNIAVIHLAPKLGAPSREDDARGD